MIEKQEIIFSLFKNAIINQTEIGCDLCKYKFGVRLGKFWRYISSPSKVSFYSKHTWGLVFYLLSVYILLLWFFGDVIF